MKQAAIVTGLILVASSQMAIAQYLTGPSRENFIQGVVGGCMREKLKDEESKVIPNALFERAYCRCYATTLADRIPAAELSMNSPTDTPVTRAASQTCYQSMKAEAVKLYQENRRPDPGFNAQMDSIRKEVDQDMKGPLAREAIVACRRVAGISAPVQTAPEAIRAGYSAEVAIKFADCIANYMYPVDARKSEELDRKANRR